MSREVPKYRQKFGTPPSKYVYTFPRCEHRHSHVERSFGGPYRACDACNTIRENLNPQYQAHLKTTNRLLKAA